MTGRELLRSLRRIIHWLAKPPNGAGVIQGHRPWVSARERKGYLETDFVMDRLKRVDGLRYSVTRLNRGIFGACSRACEECGYLLIQTGTSSAQSRQEATPAI